MMNMQTPKLGYVVEALFWEQSGKISPKSFIDADLLTARQAAHHYAQTLTTQKLPTERLDIEIYLAEYNSQQAILSYSSQVFACSFHPSQHILEEDTYTERFSLDLTHVGGDNESIDLTVDLAQEDCAYGSLQDVWNNLAELASELELYQTYGYNTGFGCVLLDEIGAYPLLPAAEELVALSDQELRQHLLRLQEAQALPYRSFTVLYDAYTYASSLVHNFNQHYAAEDEKLSVHVEFLGNHQALLPTTSD